MALVRSCEKDFASAETGMGGYFRGVHFSGRPLHGLRHTAGGHQPRLLCNRPVGCRHKPSDDRNVPCPDNEINSFRNSAIWAGPCRGLYTCHSNRQPDPQIRRPQRSMGQALKLAAYSSTAAWVAGGSFLFRYWQSSGYSGSTAYTCCTRGRRCS